MLTKNMNLKQMLEFSPNDDDMMMLNLEIIVYIKALFMSTNFEKNTNTIKLLISDKDSSYYFKDISKTFFYNFESKDNKCLTITELYSKAKVNETIDYIKDILNKTEDTKYTLYFYTHDNHQYIMQNLEGYNEIENYK